MSGAETGAEFGAGWKLLITAFFVALNGYFVAAEFALVKVRASRIDTLARAGGRAARATLKVLGNLNLYLSSCQLGITISSLVLGWLAEPAVATVLLSGAEAAGLDVAAPGIHLAALAIALTIITILHMTFGEQAPKIYALHRPEKISLAVALPLIWFTAVLKPFIWLIDAISNRLLRWVGVTSTDGHEEVHDAEELSALLRTASHAGRISDRQRMFGENVLGLVNLQVRHIMLPRVDVVSLSTKNTQERNLAIVGSSGHSRFPLGDPDLDSALGMVHGRDVIAALLKGGAIDFKEMARPLPSVPDRQELGRLLVDLQRQRRTCAQVVDEYGSVVGLAFLEDALEEIVGPIQDEFDNEGVRIKKLDDGGFEMAGTVPLPEAADLLGISPGRGAEDTIGGHVVSALGHLPVEGEQIDMRPYQVTVKQMSRRRIVRLRFDRIET